MTPVFDSRPLTPAEKYYTFLDTVTPMNVVVAGDLDRCLAADLVAQRWTQFTSLRSLPRLRIRGDLTLADGDAADSAFNAHEAAADGWDEYLARELRRPFGLDRPMRCLYLTSAAENRSRLVFIAHHAVVDGRVGVAELQMFVRLLDGRAIPHQQRLSVAPASSKQLRWRSDRQELISLLREIAARNDAAGAPDPASWPRPDAERRPRLVSLTVAPAEAAGLLAAAKSRGMRAHSAIAAAWLIAAARRVGERPHPTLQLSSPVDLAVPSPDPDRPTAPAVSVVAHRHQVTPQSPWELAQRVGAATDASISRGEAELFFHLTRVEAIDDLEAGARVVAHALASAPPAISVSNMGVISADGDPDWLRTVYGILAPTPNQMVFASAVSYRGCLTHSVGTDDTQLPADVIGSLIDDYRAVVRTMGSAEPVAGTG
jgi:hypothetical protein